MTLGRLGVVVGAREDSIGPRMTWGHVCKVSLDLRCPWDPSAACHQVSPTVVVVGGVHDGVMKSMLALREFFESNQILLQAV